MAWYILELQDSGLLILVLGRFHQANVSVCVPNDEYESGKAVYGERL